MPWFAYILKCHDGELYYGSTADLRRRLEQHHKGMVRSTSWRRPIQLVWFQAFETAAQARQRERSFKNGRTRKKMIESLIRSFPEERLAPFV
jgi:predicted GIY-YIG superfamily endonuclease